MKKTENYHLSQWDLTDPIRMDDFNADNAALEAALTAEKQRVDAELAKKASASALETSLSRLETGKAEFVTILDTTYNISVNYFNIPVSGLNLAQYALLSLEFPNFPQDNCLIGLNGSQGTCFHASGEVGHGNNSYIAQIKGPAQLLMFPMKHSGNPVRTMAFSKEVNRGISDIPYSQLSYFQVIAASNFTGPVAVRILGIK